MVYIYIFFFLYCRTPLFHANETDDMSSLSFSLNITDSYVWRIILFNNVYQPLLINLVIIIYYVYIFIYFIFIYITYIDIILYILFYIFYFIYVVFMYIIFIYFIFIYYVYISHNNTQAFLHFNKWRCCVAGAFGRMACTGSAVGYALLSRHKLYVELQA